MYKTKTKKLLSLGLLMLLLASLFCIPAVAEDANLFTNPEFVPDGNDITGWDRNEGVLDQYPTVSSNIITPDNEAYNAPAGVTGNIFTGKVAGFGLKTKDYILLPEDGKCYITVWYKSDLDSVMQVVVEEYALDSSTRLKAHTIYCPSIKKDGEAEWVQHRVRFVATNGGERVKVLFRINNYEDNLAENANVYFMSPYLTTEMPANYVTNGDFENCSISEWGTIDTANGTKTLGMEQNGNHYLEMKNETADKTFRMTWNSSATELFSYEAWYKISFKFMPISEGSTPTVECVRLNASGNEINKETVSGTPLGTTELGKWTQYVYYFQLKGQHASTGTNAERIQIRPRAGTGMTVGYDDFKIEPAVNNAMVYQNGVETATLEAGTPVTARYHNVSTADATFIMARYTVENNVAKLVDVKIVSAPKEMTAIANDVILEISNPEAGDVIKAFAFNTSTSLTPETEPSVATVAAASIAD